jgi:hypothetical protein
MFVATNAGRGCERERRRRHLAPRRPAGLREGRRRRADHPRLPGQPVLQHPGQPGARTRARPCCSSTSRPATCCTCKAGSEIDWEPPGGEWPEGVQRQWRFTVERAWRRPAALPLRWTFGDYSPVTLNTGRLERPWPIGSWSSTTAKSSPTARPRPSRARVSGVAIRCRSRLSDAELSALARVTGVSRDGGKVTLLTTSAPATLRELLARDETVDDLTVVRRLAGRRRHPSRPGRRAGSTTPKPRSPEMHTLAVYIREARTQIVWRPGAPRNS